MATQRTRRVAGDVEASEKLYSLVSVQAAAARVPLATFHPVRSDLLSCAGAQSRICAFWNGSAAVLPPGDSAAEALRRGLLKGQDVHLYTAAAQHRATPVGIAPATTTAALLVYGQDGAVAAELVIAAAKGDACEAQQGQRGRAHDAWLARHVEVAAASARTAALSQRCKE